MHFAPVPLFLLPAADAPPRPSIRVDTVENMLFMCMCVWLSCIATTIIQLDREATSVGFHFFVNVTIIISRGFFKCENMTADMSSIG